MAETTKPVVRFRSMGYPIFVGGSPLVYALDHPRLGEQPVRTSEVQNVFSENEKVIRFETLNTVYQLAEGVDDYGF